MGPTIRGVAQWGLAACAVAALSAPAYAMPGAGLDACGDIYVETEAECTVVPPGAECEAQCDPISVEAVCAIDLAADCRAQCDKLPSVSCTGGCVAECVSDCKVDPGKFDCQADCGATCAGSCDAECSAAVDKRHCMTSCEGSCSASCDSACDIRAPSADCEARCEASCDGSCEIDTNLQCQLDCQAEGRLACEARVEGGCKVDCRKQEGALFCDGYYIDHGDNLQQCIDALQAELAAHVMGEASGSTTCVDGVCTTRGQAKVSTDCAVAAPGAAPRSFLGSGGLVGALALVALRLRRKRDSRR